MDVIGFLECIHPQYSIDVDEVRLGIPLEGHAQSRSRPASATSQGRRHRPVRQRRCCCFARCQQSVTTASVSSTEERRRHHIVIVICLAPRRQDKAEKRQPRRRHQEAGKRLSQGLDGTSAPGFSICHVAAATRGRRRRVVRGARVGSFSQGTQLCAPPVLWTSRHDEQPITCAQLILYAVGNDVFAPSARLNIVPLTLIITATVADVGSQHRSTLLCAA